MDKNKLEFFFLIDFFNITLHITVKQVAYANNNTKTPNTIYSTYNTGYLRNTSITVLYT